MCVCDFCAQSEASIYRAANIIFLYEGVYLQTPLARTGKLSWRRVFGENRPQKLMVGKSFVYKLTHVLCMQQFHTISHKQLI